MRAEPIINLNGHSADRRWGVAVVPAGGAPPVSEALIHSTADMSSSSLSGRLCRPVVAGRRTGVIQPFQNWNNGEAVTFTLAAHESLPPFPPAASARSPRSCRHRRLRRHAAICARKCRSGTDAGFIRLHENPRAQEFVLGCGQVKGSIPNSQLHGRRFDRRASSRRALHFAVWSSSHRMKSDDE